jgi:glycosyltransferase involved in cell wall biosynthesis
MPEWRLLIAGDGPDKERLTDLVSKNNVNDRVTFLGKLERQELFSQIHSSHIFALLSTFESFSFQIVEAMHIGTPVIAANIGNLSEIVDSGSNGVLISPKDIDAFIENAKKFIEDDLYREKVIEAAKQRAKDFSVEKTLDKLAEVFRDLSGKI